MPATNRAARQARGQLLPRSIHVFFLVVLNDTRAKAGATRKRGSRLSRCTILGRRDGGAVSIRQDSFRQRMPSPYSGAVMIDPDART